MEVHFESVRIGIGSWRYILGRWVWVDIFMGRRKLVEMGGGIFWVSGNGWTFFMGGWGR